MTNAKDPKFIEAICKKYRRTVVTFHKMSDGVKTDIDAKILTFFNDDQERLYSAVETLYNVSCFCERSREYETFFLRYWERINPDNKSTEQLLDDAKELLNYFEEKLKPILHMSGNNAMLEELEAEKAMLGRYFNKMGLESGNNNKHYLFQTIRKYRNSIHKNSSIEDPGSGHYLIPHNDDEDLENLICLCSCGLLIIVDKYKANIDKYLEDHKDEWMVPEEGNDGEAKKFDFDSFIDGYVASLNDYTKARMAEKVGHYGGLSNTSGLLMTLYLKKETSSVIEWDDTEGEDESPKDKKKEIIIPMGELSELDERTCFILGNPGAGKTTVLLNMILEHCEEYQGTKDKTIPVLLNLNELRGGGLNIEEHILNAIKDRSMFSDTSQEDILNGLKSRKVTYYIDGINEAHIENRESFMMNLKDFANRMENCSFYITGRKYEFASYRKIFSSLENNGIFEVQNISDQQRHDFLQQLGMTPENIMDFKSKMEDSDIQDLLGTPLNFYLIAKSFILNESNISFRNRGELLDSVMDRILSENFKSEGKKISREKFVARSRILLPHMARTMFESSNPSYINEQDIVLDSFSQEEMDEILLTLHEMNILDRREKFGIYEIRFFVDTYYEYYLAVGLIKKFHDEGCAIEKTGIDFSNKDMKETLKLIIEIISSKKITELERAFVSGILENGKKDTPEEFNDHLELLCDMVMGLKSNNDISRPNARMIVENLVLNYLVHYRCTHKAELRDDSEYLEKLFGYAVSLSSKRILNEIFSLYWLSNLGITDFSELQIKGISNLKEAYPIRNVIIRNCKDICQVYSALQKLWSSLTFAWPKTAQNLKNFIFSIFMGSETKSQKKLYAHIRKQAEKETDPTRRNLLLTDANMLLLFVNEMDFVEKFNIKEFNLQIYWPPVKALMRLHEDSRLAEFVLSDDFIEKLSHTKQLLLYMIRFHLFRGLIPEALSRFIFGDSPKILKYITEDEYRTLLDIIPANRIPKNIVRKYYNQEIHNFVVRKIRNDQEESYSSLIYNHFHSDKESITISIKNIQSSFTDTHAIFSIDGKTYEHRILEDRWQLARQTRFIFSSSDGSLIPASGTITTAGGKEYAYLAYAPGNVITVIVYDEVMASDLQKDCKPDNTLTLNGTSCRFSVKTGNFNRYRTLRIEKRSDIALTELTGEVMFAQKKKNTLLPVLIDKQTRDEEERHNRENFRKLPAKPKNSTSLPYYVIGIHDNCTWIACDPLKGAEPFDNQRALLCESTGLGATYSGKVQQAGHYGQKLVELTFMSRLKPNIQKKGKVSVIYPGRTEEKYEYIYSFASHKTVVLRFREDVFPDRSVLEDIISCGRRQEIMFKVSDFDMHLESAEFINAKGVYCLGVHIDKGMNTHIPATGLVRRADKKNLNIQRLAWTECPEINGITSCEISPETNSAIFFLADDSIKDDCSHYICIDGSPLHLKIKGQPEKLQWMAQMVLPLDINWPASKGLLRFEGLEGHLFRFMHLSDDEIRLWPSEGEITFKEFSRFMETAETVEIHSDANHRTCCIQSHDAPIEDSSRAYLLRTDFPSNDTGDIMAWSVPEEDRVMLASRTVINNRKSKVKIIEFMRNTATYTRVDQEIQIIRPYTSLKDIWVEVDNGKKFKVTSVTEADDDSNYIRLCLRDKENLAPNLKNKGEIRFFIRDKDKFKDTRIGYQNIFSLIDWHNPGRYHADICNILEYELIESDIEINDTVRNFFKEKSRSYSLVSNPVLFSKVKSALNRNNINNMVFDVCTVVSSANDTQLSAVSYLQKNLVTTSDTCDIHKYAKGDYILYEKNHKIHHLENPPQHSSLGFFKGTAIKRLKDGNCFIRVAETGDDFYCSTELKLGDTVQFFASYNMIDTKSPNRNLAHDVDMKNLKKKAVKTCVVSDKKLIIENGTETLKITVTCDKRVLDIALNRKDSIEWIVMSSWNVGDTHECFFCGKELYVKY